MYIVIDLYFKLYHIAILKCCLLTYALNLVIFYYMHFYVLVYLSATHCSMYLTYDT